MHRLFEIAMRMWEKGFCARGGGSTVSDVHDGKGEFDSLFNALAETINEQV